MISSSYFRKGLRFLECLLQHGTDAPSPVIQLEASRSTVAEGECGTCGERKRGRLLLRIEEGWGMGNASVTLPACSSERMSGIRTEFADTDIANRLPIIFLASTLSLNRNLKYSPSELNPVPITLINCTVLSFSSSVFDIPAHLSTPSSVYSSSKTSWCAVDERR
jgi:hypothetical protein